MMNRMVGTKENGKIKSLYVFVECSVCGAKSKGKTVDICEDKITDTTSFFEEIYWLDQIYPIVQSWNRRYI